MASIGELLFFWRRSAVAGDAQVPCPLRGHAVDVESCFACAWGSASAGGTAPSLACRVRVDDRGVGSLRDLLYQRGQF
jgi:hypothetical protein